MPKVPYRQLVLFRYDALNNTPAPKALTARQRGDMITTALLREAFKQSELTHIEVANRMGWKERGKADGRRVKRYLGLVPETTRNGGRRVFKVHTHRKIATKLLRAMDIEPMDYGL